MQRGLFSHCFEMVSCIVDVWTWWMNISPVFCSTNFLCGCAKVHVHMRERYMRDRLTEKSERNKKQTKKQKKECKHHNISTNIISQLPSKTLIDQENLETGLFLWLEWLFRCRRHLGKICGSINSGSTPIQKH